MIRETLEHLGRSPLTEKHKSMVSTMDAFVGPNAQDGAERLITATGHLFEDVMAIGVAGEVLADHLSEGFGKKYGEEHLQRDLSSFSPLRRRYRILSSNSYGWRSWYILTSEASSVYSSWSARFAHLATLSPSVQSLSSPGDLTEDSYTVRY